MLILSVILGVVLGGACGGLFVNRNTSNGELVQTAWGLGGIIISISLFSILGFI